MAIKPAQLLGTLHRQPQVLLLLLLLRALLLALLLLLRLPLLGRGRLRGQLRARRRAGRQLPPAAARRRKHAIARGLHGLLQLLLEPVRIGGIVERLVS